MAPGILTGEDPPFFNTSLRVTKLPDASRNEDHSQRASVSSLATRSVILGASLRPKFRCPLPSRSHGLSLYPPNALLTPRLPGCDFYPRGTLGSAVSRRSSPSSSRSLILSSNVGGVRSGIIVNFLLRKGRKILEEIPALKSLDGAPLRLIRWQHPSFTLTNLARSLIPVFRTGQSRPWTYTVKV